jgi:hypothetical protein
MMVSNFTQYGEQELTPKRALQGAPPMLLESSVGAGFDVV